MKNLKEFDSFGMNEEDKSEKGKSDIVGKIMAWEDGQMDEEQEAAFFQELINNGMAWTLQGMYGRTAQALIDSGACHKAKK
jgi:hypothetical protein